MRHVLCYYHIEMRNNDRPIVSKWLLLVDDLVRRSNSTSKITYRPNSVEVIEWVDFWLDLALVTSSRSDSLQELDYQMKHPSGTGNVFNWAYVCTILQWAFVFPAIFRPYYLHVKSDASSGSSIPPFPDSKHSSVLPDLIIRGSDPQIGCRIFINQDYVGGNLIRQPSSLVTRAASITGAIEWGIIVSMALP